MKHILRIFNPSSSRTIASAARFISMTHPPPSVTIKPRRADRAPVSNFNCGILRATSLCEKSMMPKLVRCAATKALAVPALRHRNLVTANETSERKLLPSGPLDDKFR
jgi:hypothetical protein